MTWLERDKEKDEVLLHVSVLDWPSETDHELEARSFENVSDCESDRAPSEGETVLEPASGDLDCVRVTEGDIVFSGPLDENVAVNVKSEL